MALSRSDRVTNRETASRHLFCTKRSTGDVPREPWRETKTEGQHKYEKTRMISRDSFVSCLYVIGEPPESVAYL